VRETDEEEEKESEKRRNKIEIKKKPNRDERQVDKEVTTNSPKTTERDKVLHSEDPGTDFFPSTCCEF